MKESKEIWPFGRFEVIFDSGEYPPERLNGFHTEEEAREAAKVVEGAVVIDRADKFSGSLDDLILQHENGHEQKFCRKCRRWMPVVLLKTSGHYIFTHLH